MKLSLTLLLSLAALGFAQTTAVTKNPNTNQITGNLVMGANRTLQFDPNSFLQINGTLRTGGSGDSTGKVQVNSYGTIFGSVDAMLTVQGRNNHAVIARTPTPSDGIAIVGWSSSGAAAVKATQDTYFNSPALTVWRDLSMGNSGLENSAGLLLAASNGSSATEKSFEIQSNATSTFRITWNGFASSRDKPLCRFLGRLSSAPAGTFGTDFAAGDLYFNTANNTFYCHDGISWKPM